MKRIQNKISKPCFEAILLKKKFSKYFCVLFLILFFSLFNFPLPTQAQSFEEVQSFIEQQKIASQTKAQKFQEAKISQNSKITLAPKIEKKNSFVQKKLAIKTDPPEFVWLILPDRKLKLNFKVQPDLLVQTPQYHLKIQDQNLVVSSHEKLLKTNAFFPLEVSFKSEISPENLHHFLSESGFYKTKNQAPAKITMNEKGWVTFGGGIPQSGYDIDEPALVVLLNRAIETHTPFVRVPAQKKFQKIEVSQNLKDRGITDVLAVGASNYAGSSWARRKNIRAGANRFSGMIVKKDATFSFNQQLRSVDEKYGFVKELVIKGNETVKELGGGVCQVSTTAFRAAFEAGLPIAERRNHSYSVPYYKPRGLDASIYLGGSDFKFTNDTEGDILIQTVIQGDDIYFVFYGTPDNRTVSFEGPFISNYRKAPPTQVVESEELPEGVQKKVSNAHAGFRAEWIRNVTRGENVNIEKIVSNYRPWAEKHVIGIGKVNQEEASLETKIEDEKDPEKLKQKRGLTLLKF